jgi:hypothetical protein
VTFVLGRLTVGAEVLLLAASCWVAELLVLAASCLAVASCLADASVVLHGTLEGVVEETGVVETGVVAVEEKGVVVASMVGGTALALPVPLAALACRLVVGVQAASLAASWAAASIADVASVLAGVVRAAGHLLVDIGLAFGLLQLVDSVGR